MQETPLSPEQATPEQQENTPEVASPTQENIATVEVSALQIQIAELEDRLKRSFAEQQNQRQRMLKNKANADRYAGAKLAGDLLEVIDNLERAVAAVPSSLSDNEHIENITTGIRMVLEQIIQVLAAHRILKIHPMGEIVNYELHETIAEVDDNPAATGCVIDVLQSGYILHDRLLRPAKVIISSGKTQQDSPETSHVDPKI